MRDAADRPGSSDRQPTADDEGHLRVVIVGLSREAKGAWKTYFNAHADEQVDLAGDLSAAWSKLEEYPARLALVIHCARWAAGDPGLLDPNLVDAASIAAGVRLGRWFKGEARRVYAMLEESDRDRDQRRLVDWGEL